MWWLVSPASSENAAVGEPQVSDMAIATSNARPPRGPMVVGTSVLFHLKGLPKDSVLRWGPSGQARLRASVSIKRQADAPCILNKWICPNGRCHMGAIRPTGPTLSVPLTLLRRTAPVCGGLVRRTTGVRRRIKAHDAAARTHRDSHLSTRRTPGGSRREGLHSRVSETSQSLVQVAPLHVVLGQVQRLLIGDTCVVHPSQAAQQIGPGGSQVRVHGELGLLRKRPYALSRPQRAFTHGSQVVTMPAMPTRDLLLGRFASTRYARRYLMSAGRRRVALRRSRIEARPRKSGR